MASPKEFQGTMKSKEPLAKKILKRLDAE